MMKNDNVKITVLDDGLKVVTQTADFNSVFIAAYVKTGLKNESDEENGLSHFLEHMLFKGTETKTALQLSDSIEKLGGQCNAYTSIDTTVIHTSLIPEYWKFGVDFLADIIQNSIFPKEEIERERNVIMQEIAMHENDAMSEMFDYFTKNAYHGYPLGRSILGTRKNITEFTRENLVNYFNKWYTANNIVISACGSIDHNEFVDYIKSQFKSGFRLGNNNEKFINEFTPKESRVQDIFNQSQFILAAKGLDLHATEKEKLIYATLQNVIDGGMSCRLFQEIREKHGLAYQVGLVAELLENTGYFGVHASLDEKNIDKAVELSKQVLTSVKTNITDAELEKAKNAIMYSLSLGYDSCSSLACMNGTCGLFGIKIKRYDEIKEMLKSITKQDLFDFAQQYIPDIAEDKYSLTVITPYETLNRKN